MDKIVVDGIHHGNPERIIIEFYDRRYDEDLHYLPGQDGENQHRNTEIRNGVCRSFCTIVDNSERRDDHYLDKYHNSKK